MNSTTDSNSPVTLLNNTDDLNINKLNNAQGGYGFSNNDISGLMKIKVHAFDWQIYDGEISNDKTELRAWCKDEDSKTNLVRFQGFPVMAHLELPSMVNGKYVSWNKRKAKRVFTYFQNALKKNAPFGYDFRHRSKLYYLQSKKTAFLLLMFNNLKAMKACKRLVQVPRDIKNIGGNGYFAKSIKFDLHETNVNQVRKLLTNQLCGMSQWFEVEARPATKDERISIDGLKEYIATWKTMTPLNIDKVTHASVLSFDIEANSNNIKAFPDAWNAKDIAFMISCIYRKHGEKSRNICIIYGISNPPCKPDYEYIYCDSEVELKEKFEQYICELDPDIITGYNIHGFDYLYLDKRWRRLGLQWGQIGRIKNENAILKSSTWSSSGFGHNSMNILQMSGRISIDMLNVVKREYKLPKYNLDNVSKHFELGDGKDPVTPQDMFSCVQHLKLLESMLDQLEDLRPKNSSFEGRLNGEKMMYRIHQVDKLIRWAIEQNDKKKLYNAILMNKLVKLINWVMKQMQIIAEYCLKDSILVMDLFEKLYIWIYLIELSTITGVTPMELFTRGQQARGLSVVYDLACRRGYVVDSRLFPKDSFTGGYVGDPVPGVYDHVICLDFKSLYPSIIIAYNICWTTYVPPYMDHFVKDEDCNVNEWYDEVKLKDNQTCDDSELITKGKKRYRKVYRRTRFLKAPNSDIFSNMWGDSYSKSHDKSDNSHIFNEDFKQFLQIDKPDTGQPTGPRKNGLLPELVGNFIDQRNKIQAEKNKYKKGTVEWVLREQRQLGMKQTGNSMYGLLGVTGEGGVLPLPPAAMATTAYGRRLILYCNEYVVKKYGGKIVYGDTDSLMFIIPEVKNGIEANAWGKRLEKELSALFPDPLYLEFEKAGRQFCIAKKNYVYWIYNKNGELPYDNDGEPKYMSKGIPLARRDKSLWQRTIVRKALNMIVEKESYQEFLDMIINTVVRTLRGEMSWKDFIIIKGLGSGYKDENYFMKVFAEELQKLGRPAQPGDRLEYVIVKTKEPVNLLGQRMRDPETYHRRLGTEFHEPIDYEYYIEHFLMDCIEKYWKIAYQDVIKPTMKQNKINDHHNILVDLRYLGYEKYVVTALTNNDNDPIRAVQALLLTPIKNRVINLRRKYITGRSIYDCRLNDRPIKTLLKGYNNGRLEEAVKSLASPKLYEALKHIHINN